MELRQLKYFLKAKELLNFTEAAANLYISQSTLSQQIKQLEEELGIPLFDRIGKRIVLTEAGQLFAEYAMQSISKATEGFQLIKDLNSLDAGGLKIGTTYGLRHILTPALIKFASQHPKVNIQVVFSTSQEVIGMLNSLELDFALTFAEGAKDNQYFYQLLFRSPMSFVTTSRSTMAAKKEISLNELKDLPLVLPAKGYSTRQFITDAFRRNGLSPNIAVEINDIPTVLELVKTGKWHTILSKTTADEESGVVAIPIKGKNMMRQAMIVAVKDRYVKKSAKAFCEMLLKRETV